MVFLGATGVRMKLCRCRESWVDVVGGLGCCWSGGGSRGIGGRDSVVGVRGGWLMLVWWLIGASLLMMR